MESYCVEGGCACGAVRYRASTAPIMSFHCRCRDCQRATGSGHATLAIFSRDALKVEGDLCFHAVKADSGLQAKRGFCPACGSPVLGAPEAAPGLVGVFAASLDDPSILRPQAVLYAKRAYAWDVVDPSLPAFETMMPPPNQA